MTNVLKLVIGPDQQFVAPDWPPAIEAHFKEWQRTHDRPASLTLIEARRIFAAGWNAACDELGCNDDSPRRDSAP